MSMSELFWIAVFVTALVNTIFIIWSRSPRRRP